ncbi:MAG: DUF6659 family protein [Nitrososphaeraceae archaeon]
MEYRKLCQEILNLDPKIRFAGVCDDTGETKYGGQREGVKNLLTPEETKKSNLQALARWSLRNALSTKVGKGRYAMAAYEKVKRITIPLDDNSHLLLVTTEVNADHDRIIDKVLKLIQHPSDDYMSDA